MQELHSVPIFSARSNPQRIASAGSVAELQNITTVCVPEDVIDETWRALRAFGSKGCEGFVLWLGSLSSASATVEVAFVPAQSSIRGEDGVGYFVTSETLFELNRELHRSGLRLLAQVHSHPTEAYHSSTDDAYAVVTAEGGFSLVVPDFARGKPRLATCAVYRLQGARWRELTRLESNQIFDWGTQ